MFTRLHESVASLPAESLGEGIFDVTVIRPGWGSSGYYSEALLREYGPKVFCRGVAMFANHPTEAEFANGRDVTKIMAKIYEDARWEDGRLKAKIKVGAPYREFVEDYMETIGLSIFVEGEGRQGEADGRTGLLVESLNPNDPYRSLDFVVAAGAGGAVESKLMESFRAAEARANGTAAEQPQLTENRKDNEMDREEFKALLGEFKTEFVAAVAEALKPAPVSEDVLDMAAVAEAARELPKEMRDEVYESVKGLKHSEAMALVKRRTDLVESVKKALTEQKNEEPAPGRVVESTDAAGFSLKSLAEVK
jgi:hypothetical protein